MMPVASTFDWLSIPVNPVFSTKVEKTSLPSTRLNALATAFAISHPDQENDEKSDEFGDERGDQTPRLVQAILELLAHNALLV
jgi:hypothetical protein